MTMENRGQDRTLLSAYDRFVAAGSMSQREAIEPWCSKKDDE
jgi:hypothetical protein